MKKTVFYKIYNNLGIIEPPNRQDERNDSVYYGPDAVLTKEFLDGFGECEVRSYFFPKNNEINKSDIFNIFADESEKCKSEILTSLDKGDMLVAVGGDNSIIFPAVLSDAERFGIGNIGILDFDTHGDIHLRATSPSNNIHGMYLRPFFDKFDFEEIDEMVPRKLTGEDIVYFGNFDFEKEEEEFMDRMRIKRFSGKEIKDDFNAVEGHLDSFLRNHPHIHVNFDIDIFDESLVSATGIPSKPGLTREEIFPLLEIISGHASRTLTLSEISAGKSGIDKTANIAREVVSALVGN